MIGFFPIVQRKGEMQTYLGETRFSQIREEREKNDEGVEETKHQDRMLHIGLCFSTIMGCGEERNCEDNGII